MHSDLEDQLNEIKAGTLLKMVSQGLLHCCCSNLKAQICVTTPQMWHINFPDSLCNVCAQCRRQPRRIFVHHKRKNLIPDTFGTFSGLPVQASEDHAKKAMADAARLAEELRQEQEHAGHIEKMRRALEAQVRRLTCLLQSKLQIIALSQFSCPHHNSILTITSGERTASSSGRGGSFSHEGWKAHDPETGAEGESSLRLLEEQHKTCVVDQQKFELSNSVNDCAKQEQGLVGASTTISCAQSHLFSTKIGTKRWWCWAGICACRKSFNFQ